MFEVSARARRGRRSVRIVGGWVVVATLAGCSTIKGWLGIDSPEYKQQQPKPVKLEVPPDLAPQPKDDHFTVPDRKQAAAAAGAASSAAASPAGAATASSEGAAAGGASSAAAPAVALAPATAAPAVAPAAAAPVAPNGPVARIERDGAQRWLAVDESPEAVYAGIKEYLAQSDIAIVRDDPQLGLIETAWSERRARDPEAERAGFVGRTLGSLLQHLQSTGLKDRYVVRIDRIDDGHALVFVAHRGMEEVYTSNSRDTTVWQPAPPAPELEAEMLQRLLVKLAGISAPVKVASTTKLAPAPAPAAAVDSSARTPAPSGVGELVKGGQGRVVGIDLDQPFDRAWRQVGLALDRGGFTVEDRDRSKGLFFVRYIDPEYEQGIKDKQGWLPRLFGRDPKISAQQFRIALASTDARTRVTVQNHDGEPEGSATGERIINLVRDQLR